MNIPKEKPKIDTLSGYHFFGIFTVSMSALLLEFAMTRVLSVSLWYNFAFMIISIALLGFGASGVILTLFANYFGINDAKEKEPKSKPKIGIDKLLSVLSLMYGVSILLSFWLINKIPFDPFSLLRDSMQFVYMPLYYLLITIPFLFAGLIISILISKFHTKITKLYFFDLLGAGLACFAFVILMPEGGGNGTVVFSSIFAFVATLFFSFKNHRLLASSALILIGLAVSLYIDRDDKLPIVLSPNKEYYYLANQRPDLRILTEWNTFSKIDILVDEDEPVDGYKLYIAVIDGGNANANIPSLKSLPPPQKPADASNLAFINKDSCENVYIIGSAGGGEILTSLYHNAKNITGVEINGILNDLISNKLAYWTNALVRNNKVNIVTDDARAYLHGQKKLFDVIISAHTISASALSSGAMSMVENFILTKEALKEYLEKLKLNGILYISRPEIQLPKLITTLRAVDYSSADDFRKKIVLFKRTGNSGTIEESKSYLAGVIYKKDGFSQPDILNLRNESLKLGLEILYDYTGSRNDYLKSLVENQDLESVIKNSTFSINPATDNKPFFDNSFGFNNINFTNLLDVFAQGRDGLFAFKEKPVAEATLLALLVQVIIIGGLFLLLPFLFLRKSKKNSNFRFLAFDFRLIFYFAFLGIGYITIQISLMQKFIQCLP